MKNDIKKYAYILITSLSCALFIFLCAFITGIAVEYTAKNYEGALIRANLDVIHTVVLLILYVSITDLFVYNDKFERSEWKNNGKKPALAILSIKMLCETFFIILFSALQKDGLKSIYEKMTGNSALSVILLIISVLAAEYFIRIKNIKKWRAEPDNAKTSIGRVIVSGIAILMLTYIAPFVLIFLFAQSNAFVFILKYVWWIAPAALATVYTVKYVKAFNKRKLFLSELKKICALNGYELTILRSPYSSVLQDSGKTEIMIGINGTPVKCKLLCCLNKSSFLYVFNDGAVVKSLQIKIGPLRLFTLRSRIDFEDKDAYLIITSPPYETYNGSSQSRVPIDNGDRVGDLKVYFSVGFLNTLERKGIK